MASKHTPGPWIAASSPSSIVGWPVVSKEGRPICSMPEIPPELPNADNINAETLANAHLIAAAPEMLAVLEGVHAHGYVNSGDYRMVKNVIDKAKGGAV